MRIYFVRHGESVNNGKGLFTGQMDAPLNDVGRAQATALCAKLSGIKFDRIYSSDLSRAIETAKLAIPGCDCTTDSRIREINVGYLSGLSTTEFRRDHPDLAGYLNSRDYTHFGGENEDAVITRVRAFISDLSGVRADNVAVFCHGGILYSAMVCALGVKFPLRNLHNPNCAIAIFELTDGVLRLVSWNV